MKKGENSEWYHGHSTNDTDVSDRQIRNKRLRNPRTGLHLTNLFPDHPHLIPSVCWGERGCVSGSTWPPLRGVRVLFLFLSGQEAFLHRQTHRTKPLFATWDLYGDPQPALSVVVESVSGGQDRQLSSLKSSGEGKKM